MMMMMVMMIVMMIVMVMVMSRLASWAGWLVRTGELHFAVSSIR